MKKTVYFLVLTITFIVTSTILQCQPLVDFILPDSSCVGLPITITNLTSGGSTYYWNFCSGNANNDPLGSNIGNPGSLLNVPTYITLVKDGVNYYSFISSQLAGVIRYNHGNSFSHNPVSWTNLGTFSGLLGNLIEGIQVKYDNGAWYGFVCNDNALVRLNFGNSLNNNPTAVSLGPFLNLNMLHGLCIIKEGSTWLGFATCSTGGKIVRFNFGNSLSTNPSLSDLGNLGVIQFPGPFYLVQNSSLWYCLMIDSNSKLLRLCFGNSLFNTPTAQNLGNPGGFNNAGGLSIVQDCNLIDGYFTNYLPDGQLGKFEFSAGITGTISGQVLGNVGGLNLPHSFSELFRQNDTLFAYITNRGSNSLTRLIFPPCTNASVPSSTQYNPPSFSYNQPGTYNVRLIVNEGMSDQVSLCKSIVISPPPTVDLGPDRFSCIGNPVILDAGPGYSSYLWSTGATTRTISAPTSGTYSVTITKSGCSASDFVNVIMGYVTSVDLGPDTTVCIGQPAIFDAGPHPYCTFLWLDLDSGSIVGTSQTYSTTTAGRYEVIVSDTIGCQAIDSVQLITVSSVEITNNPLNKSICTGSSTDIFITSNAPGTIFSWTATGSSPFVTGYSSGSGNPIDQILINSNSNDETVTYTITPHLASCIGPSVEYTVTVSPLVKTGVTIMVSDDTVCPGTQTTFTSTSFNQGSSPVYQWRVNRFPSGQNSPSFTYLPSDKDTVDCLLRSSITCPENNPISSNEIIIRLHSVNPVNLGPDTSVCIGNTFTFDAGPCPGCTYIWADLTTGQGNIGTNQTLTTGNAGMYCVSVTNKNGCISKDTANLSYQVVSPVISGNNIPCSDSSVYSYSTQAGMSQYQWSVSPGGLILSGQGTNLVDVRWASEGNQSIMVNYTSPAGCSAASPSVFPVTVYAHPSIAGPIRGSEKMCTVYDNEIYSTDSIPFAQTYVWSSSPGLNIISGQGTTSISVIADDTSTSGELFVYAVNFCGNGPVSNTFMIRMLHSQHVDAGSDQTIPVHTATNLTSTVSEGSGNYSYIWMPGGLLVSDTAKNPRTLDISSDTTFILIVTDLSTGCRVPDSVRVSVIHNSSEECLVIYNVITPNGDNLNDTWVIDCIETFPQNNVRIFNIWGDEVNSFENYNNRTQVWNGTSKSGKRLPDGTYYYVLSIKNGGTHCGWVMVRGNQ